jgi:hypothetical protein
MHIQEIIDEIKCMLRKVCIQVRDRLECQGRQQVKVLISNLISKCEYYFCEFDRRKLTLSNVVFQQRNLNVENNKDNSNIEDPTGTPNDGDNDNILANVHDNSNQSFNLPTLN